MREEGYRELILTGIEISSWGRDLPGKPELASFTALGVCSISAAGVPGRME